LFRKTLTLVPFVVFPVLVLLAAACSSSNNNKSNIVPANNAAAPANPVSSSSQSSPGVGGAQSFTQTFTDNKFSIPDLTVKANQPVTINFDNKGTGIHNWDVVGQKDSAGNDLKSKLLNPGESQSLPFTISKPGKYNVQCDVHPADMKGTLTVQ